MSNKHADHTNSVSKKPKPSALQAWHIDSDAASIHTRQPKKRPSHATLRPCLPHVCHLLLLPLPAALTKAQSSCFSIPVQHSHEGSMRTQASIHRSIHHHNLKNDRNCKMTRGEIFPQTRNLHNRGVAMLQHPPPKYWLCCSLHSLGLNCSKHSTAWGARIIGHEDNRIVCKYNEQLQETIWRLKCASEQLEHMGCTASMHTEMVIFILIHIITIIS